MAKEFAAGEFLLQRGAVLDNHRIGGKRRMLMDQTGDHIFAGSRLAGDQHRYSGRRHLFNEKLDVAHRL